MTKPANRMEYLTTHFFASLGVRVSELQAKGADVIRLDEGSPDLPPAPAIIDALARAASNQDSHGYQAQRGTPALRQAWAQMYRRLYSVDIDPDTEVQPLMGSKEGIFHIIQAFINPGDIVLVPDPGYITYTRGTLFAGGKPYFFPLHKGNGYLPDLHKIPDEVIDRAKMIWLNYPNNPTAAVATVDFFSEVVEFARKHELLVCHDAAYTQVNYDGYQSPSILQITGAKELCVEFNTLSKSHNMAGWRVAAAIGNASAIRTLYTLKTNVDSGHFRAILDAATYAMNGDQTWLSIRNQQYQQRRDILVQRLRSMGFQVGLPKASLYVWCPVPSGWTSLDFSRDLLDKTCVSLTPGIIFGENGEGFTRISLTAPTERISEAMDRLENWMDRWHSVS